MPRECPPPPPGAALSMFGERCWGHVKSSIGPWHTDCSDCAAQKYSTIIRHRAQSQQKPALFSELPSARWLSQTAWIAAAAPARPRCPTRHPHLPSRVRRYLLESRLCRDRPWTAAAETVRTTPPQKAHRETCTRSTLQAVHRHSPPYNTCSLNTSFRFRSISAISLCESCVCERESCVCHGPIYAI